MTQRELAEHLSKRIQALRLERIGETVPDTSVPFERLPADEQQNWMDMAQVVLEYLELTHPVARLQDLGTDWLRYTMVLGRDPAWRDEMRRAVVVEMRVELDKLARECGL